MTAIRRSTDTIGGPCTAPALLLPRHGAFKRPLENIKCSCMYEIRNVTGPWGNPINILQHLAQPTLNQEMCEKACLCHKCLLLNNLCFCST